MLASFTVYLNVGALEAAFATAGLEATFVEEFAVEAAVVGWTQTVVVSNQALASSVVKTGLACALVNHLVA